MSLFKNTRWYIRGGFGTVWKKLEFDWSVCDNDTFTLFMSIVEIFMDRISQCSQVVEGVGLGGPQIPSLLFADDVILLASSSRDLQVSLGRFGPVRMRISH